jgi:hypothetical protein
MWLELEECCQWYIPKVQIIPNFIGNNSNSVHLAAICVHLSQIPNHLKTNIGYEGESSAVIYARAPVKWSQFQLI